MEKRQKFNVYRMPGKSGNVIVSHAIGGNYLKNWENNSLDSWLYYCEKHDLGLVILIELILDDEKKIHWQKLLIGNELSKLNIGILNACYLDTDIFINPGASNIFNEYNNEKIGLISQYKNLPYNRLGVLRRLAFFRHNYYSKNYSLDSSLFFSAKETYKYHDLPPLDDYACMGVFLINLENHSNFLFELFHNYKSGIKSLDGGSEEVYLNHAIISNNLVQWLSYKWQSLWIFEMPWCHSHLYFDQNKETIVQSIKASLFNCNFLHFAGTWEGIHWNECQNLFKNLIIKDYLEFENYLNTKLERKPKGINHRPKVENTKV
jgi:aromatic ring-cleaving dioxygenase